MASHILVNGKPLGLISESLYGNQRLQDGIVANHYDSNHKLIEEFLMEWLRVEGYEGMGTYIPDKLPIVMNHTRGCLEPDVYSGAEFRGRLVLFNTVLRIMGSWDGNQYTGSGEIFAAIPKDCKPKYPKDKPKSDDLPF